MQKKRFSILVLLLSVFVNYQVSGSVVLSGNNSSNSIQKQIQNSISMDGFLDQTFGKLGANYISQSISGSTNTIGDFAYGLALQSDGKIVLVGSSQNDVGSYFAVARFTIDGQLDPTFGAGNPNSIIPGTVYIQGSIAGAPEGQMSDQANAVVIQADGKIIVGGYSTFNNTPTFYFAVARFLSNGSLDESFGAGNSNSIIPGTIFIPAPIAGGGDGGTHTFADQIFALALQVDGNIVAAGYSNNPTTNISHFAAARFTTEGLLDTAFGQGADYSFIPGTIAVPAPIAGGGGAGVVDYVQGVAIQADRSIVLGGFSQYPTGNYSYFALAQITPEGFLDTSFAQGNPNSLITGTVFINGSISGITTAADQAQALAIQTDGAILLGGWSINQEGGSNFAVARFLSNGFLDESFGKNNSNSFIAGTVYVPACIAGHTPDSQDKAYGLALQNDGKLVAAGYSTDFSGNPAIALARFTSQGNPDQTFGLGNSYSLQSGTVYFPADLGGVQNRVQSIGIQQDGKIVVGETAGQGMGNNYFAIARFFNPPSFAFYQTSYISVGAGLNC